MIFGRHPPVELADGTGCWFFQESLPSLPLTIINDTDASATSRIEFDGREDEPRDGDASLAPGEQTTISLSGPYTLTNELGIGCSDGPSLAREGSGSDIRVPAPICSGETVRLSEYQSDP